MRKIKCKAYIKHLKKLVPVDVIDFLNEEVEVNTSEDGGASIYRFDEVELLWCTKLTDKNGKEIYEGDIVKLVSTEWADDDPIIDVVEWGLGDRSYPAFDLKKFSYETEMNSFSYIFNSGYYEIEVIGNIFEDKHLLKKESK